jgi:hypothetical protein
MDGKTDAAPDGTRRGDNRPKNIGLCRKRTARTLTDGASLRDRDGAVDYGKIDARFRQRRRDDNELGDQAELELMQSRFRK